MRTRTFGLCLVLFVAFATASLVAQSHTPFKIQIPVDFVVNDRVFPAGEYTIAQQGTDWETLSGPGGRVVAFAPATLRGELGSNNLLIFHQLGDKYYLAELWTAGTGSGRAINSRSLSDRMDRTFVARAVRDQGQGTALATSK